MSEIENEKSGLRWLLLSIGLVVSVWGLNWFLGMRFLPTEAERSSFGGLFGAASALFSGLAFAFLTYTIWQQHQELQLQRRELILQREALEEQAKELKRQADQLEQTTKLQQESLRIQRAHSERLEQQDVESRERFTKSKFVQYGFVNLDQSSGMQIVARLRNIGAFASSLKVTSDTELVSPLSPFDLEPQHILPITWRIEPRIPPDLLVAEISYTDTLGERQSQRIKVIKVPEAKTSDEMYKISTEEQ